MRLIDADRLLDRCIFYHLPNGDLAVPIIDVQHAPTVEAPDINVGNMDAISRQQAIEAFETAAKSGASIEDIKLVFENLPSVQPDIIRCKDCKYYKYGICMKIGANKSFYGFCDWAERREDG